MRRGIYTQLALLVLSLMLLCLTIPAEPAAGSQGGAHIVRVPILMYHYIRVNPDPHDRVGADLSVTPEDFAQQMQLLAARGFHTISLDELAAAILTGAALPDRPIVLTFDDGYEDFYTSAYPILKEYHLDATSFVITGKVGWKGYLTWDQMREMQASGLVQFESHTVDHVAMSQVSLSQAQYELIASKSALEKQLDARVDIFCYPSGRYDSQVESFLAQDGYIAGVSTRPGIVHNIGDLPALTRLRIRGSDTLNEFAGKMGLMVAVPVAPARTHKSHRGLRSAALVG